MKNRKNIILGVSFVAVLAVGFYGGMEYKAYQIRTAIGDVFGGISDALSGMGDTSSKASADTKKPVVINDLTKKVSLEITKKGFATESYQSQNLLTLQFTNNTDKNIEGVQGTIRLMDLFGNQIQSVKISYDKGIEANQTKSYAAGVDYNQFMDDDIKLRQTDLAKLKYDWQVDSIIYEDGTKESN